MAEQNDKLIPYPETKPINIKKFSIKIVPELWEESDFQKLFVKFYWGFINYSMREIVEFTDSEISALQTLKSDSTPEIASILYKKKVLRKI